MLQQIHPKLPMRDSYKTKKYYIEQLGFHQLGNNAFEEYLMLAKDNIEIHFFLYSDLNPLSNYSQAYIRLKDINQLYQQLIYNKVAIHPNGAISNKPWGQREFSLLDPDNNLITFGQEL